MQFLYRAIDADKKLLYVGISNDWTRRLHQHEKNSLWFELTDHVKIERFETREAVTEAERLAIETEKPIYNKMFNREYESLQNHFAKLKDWFWDKAVDCEGHEDLIWSMRKSFNHAGFSSKRKRASVVAWCFYACYPYLDAYELIDCRNCDGLLHSEIHQGWAGPVDEEAAERGYYD